MKLMDGISRFFDKFKGDIYCTDCKFYKNNTYNFTDKCIHKNNVINKYISKSCRHEPRTRESLKRKPYQINSNNKCKWFEEKKWELQE